MRLSAELGICFRNPGRGRGLTCVRAPFSSDDVRGRVPDEDHSVTSDGSMARALAGTPVMAERLNPMNASIDAPAGPNEDFATNTC